MKHLKILFPVLLCTLLLALSSCQETNADRLRAMRGNWESVKNRPAFTLFEESGHYMVTTRQTTYRGTTRTETYQVSEQGGNLFIETGLSVLLTYDKENDRILLSPGGEYKRSNPSSKSKRMKTKLIILSMVLLLFAGKANAQWAVFDPSNLAQGIINTTKQIAQTSATVNNTLSNFKETVKVYEQGKQYYDALKSVNNLVKDAKKVQKTILLIGEISDIYVSNYQLMLSDNNYTPDELVVIGSGYAKLLSESADVLQELKNVVNINGLSMSDKERMDLIDRAYSSVKNYRDLVSYYTRKNISVSYLRAKKKKDTDRVMSLYGSADERYW